MFSIGGLMTNVYKHGPDAVKNSWELYFFGLPKDRDNKQIGEDRGGTEAAFHYPGLPAGEDEGAGALFFRAVSVTIPKFGVNTIDADFKTIKTQFLGGKIDFTPEITVTMRLDRYYAVYNDLRRWFNLFADFGGSVGMDIPKHRATKLRVRSDVQTHASSGEIGSNAPSPMMWDFLYVAPKEVPSIELAYNSGDGLQIQIPFVFAEMVPIWEDLISDDQNTEEHIGVGE